MMYKIPLGINFCVAPNEWFFVYLVNVCLLRLSSGHPLCLVDVLFG
jgi:hypothetical protein